ncbi:MAG: CDGSH iron-sulfur domain-containing protein [bacterium]
MENATIAGTKPVMVDLEAGKTYAWCACGKSSNQPWCDGSHQTTQFRPLIIKTMEPSKASLCMCKQSGSRPYCDGTHNKLTS